VVALSSTEAEYIAMTVAAQEATWLKMLLEEIGEKMIPVVVTDNEGAKKLTENPIFHRRTKHIQIRFHYI
jgi:N-acetylglutamate synthase/N-acetylornithine aminotransferase